MGISIELESELPKRGLLSLLRGKIDWEETFRRIVKSKLGEYGLSEFIPVDSERTSGRIPIHLCEEWADLTVKDDRVVVSARTSTCGPGYHAVFCEVLDQVEEDHGLNFFETEEGGDETGYFRRRDFEDLQKYFAEWLKLLCQSVANQPHGDGFHRLQLAMSQLAPETNAGMTLTARGPRTHADIQIIAAKKGGELLVEASNWFPWWQVRPDAKDYVKHAEQVMWCELPWHAPENNVERQAFIAAHSALQKASLLKGDISHLSDEKTEIEALLDSDVEGCPAPSNKGIGYRRHVCRWTIAGGWSCLLPGFLYELSEEDNYQLYCRDFVVRLSSFSVKSSNRAYKLPTPDGENETTSSGEGRNFAWRIESSREVEDNGWANTFVLAASSDSLLIATFSHSSSFALPQIQKFVDSLAYEK